jgi:hypothetical protein
VDANYCWQSCTKYSSSFVQALDSVVNILLQALNNVNILLQALNDVNILLQALNNVVYILLQALNNLQSTFQGFGHVNSENVFKVNKISN